MTAALALLPVWTASAQRVVPGLRGPGRPFPPGMGKKASGPRQNLVEHLMSLSPEQQREFMREDPRFQRLPERQKENIQHRLEEYNRLPAAQREALRERYELFRQLTPEEQEQARALYRQWNQQPADRRLELRREFRHLRESTPEERKVRMESEPFRKRFSENERELLRGLVELLPAPETQ
jgi:hypothetical protein